MKINLHFSNSTITFSRMRLLGASLLLLLLSTSSSAQTSNTDGTTPAGLSPGAPAGSYALSGFENVNLYSGNLNFGLPLAKVGGRGAAGYTIQLSVEQKWRVERWAETPPNSTPIYNPLGMWWGGLKPGYGLGVMEGRRGGSGDWPEELHCGQPGDQVYLEMLTRLTFTAADGTEFELRDQLTGGQPANVANVPCEINGNSRGTVFVTTDGSAATFISDSPIYDYKWRQMGLNDQFRPSGYLLLRDGTSYRILSGLVTQVRDANGNRIDFSFDASNRVTSITDSLGRIITINYAGTNGFSYDQLVINGFGGQSQTIKVWKDSLGNVLRSGFSLQTYAQLFPDFSGASSYSQFNPSRVSKVEFPNGRSYLLRYNSYGELARVDLPTGGRFEYDRIDGNTLLNEGVIYRRVAERRVYLDGAVTTPQNKTRYSEPGTGEVVEVRTLDSNDTLLSYTKHYFHGNALDSMSNAYTTPISYPNLTEGREYQTESFEIISGSPVLRGRVLTTWQGNGTLGGLQVNPRVIQTTTTVEPLGANLVAKQTFAHDQYNNQTDAYEHDYGSGAAPAYPTRHTHVDYLTTNVINGVTYNYNTVNPNATNPNVGLTIHIRNLASGQKVYEVNTSNGAETLKAQSEIKYDEAAYPLLIYGTVTGWTDPGTPARGLPTTTRSWLNTTSTWLESHGQYDQCGSPRKSWDARGNLSEVEYSSTYNFAYPTRTVSADPDGAGPVTSLVTTNVYDFPSGAITSTTDANNRTTTMEHGAYDVLSNPNPMQRLTRVNRPDGSWIAYGYSDLPGSLFVLTRTSLDSARSIDATEYFDGLGRAWRSAQSEGATSIFADTQYDLLGRVWKNSNPYRSGETILWATTGYDTLSRVVSVTTPNSAVVSTVYSANQVTVADQTGKKRKSVTDALGRLKEVYEDPTGLNYLTSYTYDALDNLTTVTQGSQTRTFVYDSLKRLTSATNPESGTISYQYDNNGNLTQKTDARAVSITYAYDALNRNTTVNYSDTTGINPDVSRFFDGAINGKGRFWYDYAGGNFSTGSNVEHTAIDSYDALGRPLIQRQLFKLNSTWGPTYQIQRGYNLAGGLTSQTYPSGRTVTYNYDAAGRLGDKDSQNLAFTGNLGDGVTRTYSTGIIYSSLGGMAKEQFGTDTAVYNKSFYNSRGQLSEIRVSTSYTGPTDTTWNRGAIINHHSNLCWGMCGGSNSTTSMADNNGNLKKQEVYIPHNDQVSSYTTWWQRYDYDNLNRLQRVAEMTGNPQTEWQQEYVYDRYGNRTIQQTNTWGMGINKKDFTVSTITNRLGVPGGQSGAMSYDNAGNLTTDSYTGAGSRTYDAENRMTQAWGGNNQQQFYTYNADGQRVRRKVDGVETWQVYGMDDELLAEYAANAATTSPQKEYGYRNGQLLVTAEPAAQIRWLVADQLGTPRMIIDKTGSLANVKRHDYLPFGEELFATQGLRTTSLGYTGDTIRQKFTRKERDNETNLDYFLARYYSSTQGRFTSPDEFTGGPDELYSFADDASANPTFYADLTNPQSLNKYQYTYNNPLNLTDDDGHCPVCGVLVDYVGRRVERAAVNNPEVTLDVVQAVVSVVGIVPGAGEVADVANAGISATRGNRGEAALDLAGALGPVGSVAATGNRIRKIAKAASKVDDVAEAGADVSIGVSKGVSARAARREAMRQEGIPTSQQPSSQLSTKGGRQQQYQVPKAGGGTQTKIVTNQLKDRNHGPHYEAGKPKSPPRTDPGGRLRHTNDKTKVTY